MKRLIACLLSLALLTASLPAFGEETGFTVHLDPQGGRVQEELLHTGETGTLTFLPQPVRTGYHFAGWFTQSDAQVFCNTTVFAGETTLYAKWEEGQPCITHRFDFETRDLSEDGWTLVDGDGDGYGWRLRNALDEPGGRIMEGQVALCSDSYNDELSGLHPDNWAISPAVLLPEGQVTLTLSAVAQDSKDGKEHFAVYVGSTPDPEDMVRVSGEEDPVTDGADRTRLFRMDLQAYAGQTVYIGLRHYDCYNQFQLLIDMMEISTDLWYYDLWVGDVWVNELNASDILGDGVFSFDGKDTLTIAGNCETEGHVIESAVDGLTVDVAENSLLRSNRGSCIMLWGDTQIRGRGRLTLDANSCGVYMCREDGVLTLEGIDLTVSGAYGIAANGNLEMAFFINSRVTAEGSQGAVCDFGNGLIFSGSAIVTPAKGNVAYGSVFNDDFSLLAARVVIEPDGVRGDADGDVRITSTDARLALQLSVGKIKEADVTDPAALDVDGDGSITTTDARLILQRSAGKIQDWS